MIYGAEKGETMQRVLTTAGSYSPKGLERELVALAKRMVAENPDVGAIVLECTEFPPHAFAIQDAVRMNVWDFTTLTHWMHDGALRRPFAGWI